MPPPAEKREEIARRVLDQIYAGLPPDLAPAARAIPCLLADFCPDDPEILGLYGTWDADPALETNGPIVLYLGAIAELCAEEGANFADEVRITYLHELGHHFGWDEGDLEARGLE